MKYFENCIKPAVDKFYKKDRYLIEHDVHEQAMSARIAHYLIEKIEGQDEFEKINIDCEYNKSINDPKRAGDREKYSDKPDIIAHERGTNEKNMFVIEMKKGKDACDKCKIKKFVDDSVIAYEEGYALQEIEKDSFHIFFYQRGDSEGKELDFKVTSSRTIEPIRGNGH